MVGFRGGNWEGSAARPSTATITRMLSGDLTITAGATNATITIAPQDQGIIGGTKSVTLTLASPADGTYAIDTEADSGTLTIADDGLPVVSLYATEPFPSTDEGQFTIARTGPTSDPLTVDYTAYNYYTPPIGYSYTIPAGDASATVNATLLPCPGSGDSVACITVSLTGSDSDAYTVSATDTGASLVKADYLLLAVYASNPTTAAGQTPGEFTFELNQPAPQDTTVTYGVDGLVPSAAVPGTDYTPLSGQVVIPAGQTTAEVAVDALPGGSGAVTIDLAQWILGAGEWQTVYPTGCENVATVTIAPAPALPQLTVSDAVCERRRYGNLQGSPLSQISSTESVSVPYTLVDGSAVLGTDYTDATGGTTATGTLTFQPGATEVDVVIPTLLDAANTVGQTFGLDLGDIAQANNVRSQATGTIRAVTGSLTIFNPDGSGGENVVREDSDGSSGEQAGGGGGCPTGGSHDEPRGGGRKVFVELRFDLFQGYVGCGGKQRRQLRRYDCGPEGRADSLPLGRRIDRRP